MTQLQNLLDRVNALPSENEYLDEINFINGEISTTMENAVGQTEALVASEAAVISEIITTLSSKANPSANVFTTTAKLTSNNQQISFTGLTGQPKAFAVTPIGNVTLNANNRLVMSVSFDGTTTHGIYIVSSGSSYNRTYTATYSSSYFTVTYSNGTLSITTSSTTNGGYFAANVDYALIAVY